MSREKANERINNRTGSAAPKRSYTGIVIIFSLLIVCILVGFIVLLIIGKESEGEIVTRNMVVTPENIDEVVSQLEEVEYTPPGSYEVIMSTHWTFEDGASASTDAYVENSILNRNTVYFTVTPADDDDHVVLRSPYLEAGSHLENITLDEDLDAGVYDMVLTYHLVDGDLKELSEVSVSVTITVQN